MLKAKLSFIYRHFGTILDDSTKTTTMPRFFILSILFLGLTLSSCGDDKPSKRYVSDSSGNINQLSVIIDNDNWNGELGELIRDYFAADYKGLPQQEPHFTLKQIPPSVFTGFARKNRLFIKVEQAEKPMLTKVVDSFAKPQIGYVISAQKKSDFKKLLEENSPKIIKEFQQTEIKERQRRIKKSGLDVSAIQEEFGITMDLPTAYRYAKTEDNFIWLRKDIKHGGMEILAYEVPKETIKANDSILENIIKMRDSIGQKYIPGPTESSHMSTEKAYAPYLFETKIDGHFAYEIKGTWEVKGFFMGGPFLTYAVELEDKFLILEGFVFKPSASKRNQMIEIEAILRSAKFKKSLKK